MRVISGRDLQTDEYRRRLEAISFLRTLGDLFEDEAQTVFKHCHLWRYEPQEQVMKVGDSSGSVFLVISGKMQIFGAHGELLGQLGPGEWLGDLSLFNLNSRTADVTAQETGASLLMIPKNILSPDDSSLTERCKIHFYRHISQGIRWKLEQAVMRLPEDTLKSSITALSKKIVTTSDAQEWKQHINALSAPLTQWNSYVASIHSAANSMQAGADLL